MMGTPRVSMGMLRDVRGAPKAFLYDTCLQTGVVLMRVVRPPFDNPAASGHGGLVALRPPFEAGGLFVDGGYRIRSSRIASSGCTAIDPTSLLFNNSHLEILDVLRCYQSLKTDTLAIRHISSNPSRNLARTRPRYSAISSIADAQEQRSRRLPAVASAE
jgi:hypothetical protein